MQKITSLHINLFKFFEIGVFVIDISLNGEKSKAMKMIGESPRGFLAFMKVLI